MIARYPVGHLVGSLLLAASLPAQRPPTSTLILSGVEQAEPFYHIADFRELGNGKGVVLDANEQRVVIVDFARSTISKVGRVGAGPGEYRYPTRFLSLGGDTFGIMDRGNGRLLLMDGAGRLGGVLDLWGLPVSNRPLRRAAPAEQSDTAGRLYALGYDAMASPEAVPLDSAPLERWRVGSLKRDTVAYVPLAPRDQRIIPPGEGVSAFAVEPQWAVGPDGRVAILRVRPFAVEIIGPDGLRVRGAPIAFNHIALSEDHKRLWIEDQARPRPVMIMRPGAGATPAASLRPLPVFEPVQWPQYLPPFLDDAGHFAPDGNLWIARTTQVGAQAQYDVVGRDGKLVERVTAPPNTRLVGFGEAYVYLARTDVDGTEYLGRYRRVPR